MRTPVKLNIFTINLLLIGLALATMSARAQTESALAGVSTKEEPPKVGLRVLSVEPGGRGDEVGLQTMDVIARYGNFEIVDASSYFAAREAYENSRGLKLSWFIGAPVSAGRPG